MTRAPPLLITQSLGHGGPNKVKDYNRKALALPKTASIGTAASRDLNGVHPLPSKAPGQRISGIMTAGARAPMGSSTPCGI